MIQNYRKLIAWQRGMDLAEAIYRVTAEFPSVERFGLSRQLRRAAVSVISNITEGRGRRSTKDFKRFVDIAYGSLCELETQLELAERLDFFSKEERQRTLALVSETGRLLNGLRRALVSRS
ncbi:MAG: four helix bundle protein [Acidobacteria bacterium]|nr:MAG: four helix bundle protein [Acidobacteriota bacterium]